MSDDVRAAPDDEARERINAARNLAVEMAMARRYYAKGYSDAAASHTKRALKGFLARSGSPVEDIDFNNRTLRQRGRMMYMASPVAAAAINTARTKIVGSGLHVKCAINRELLGLSEEEAKAWAKRTEAEWRMWAESPRRCDAMGVNNFYELQQLAVKGWHMSGDIFAVMKRFAPTPLTPYTLRIQLVEADRISTPIACVTTLTPNITNGINPDTKNRIFDGVEVDEYGRVVAYHIRNTYPDQITGEPTVWTRVEAVGKLTGIPNILQIMDAERPDQYRGVTYLAPIIEQLLQLRRYTESELTAAIVQSFLTAWITTDTDQSMFPFNEVGAGDIDCAPGDAPDEVSRDENEYEMGPGTINHLAPGESVTLGNPNVPTSGFEQFTKSIIRQSGAAIEQPYDVMIKEFNSSYSAAKGALEEASKVFNMRRAWFVADFCQPAYETWLAEAVATGRVNAPGFFSDPLIRAAWCGTRWDGPSTTMLDPTKEAQANAMMVEHGWKTNEQVTRESYGGNWEDNAEALIQEKKIYDAAGSAAAPTKEE